MPINYTVLLNEEQEVEYPNTKKTSDFEKWKITKSAKPRTPKHRVHFKHKTETGTTT